MSAATAGSAAGLGLARQPDRQPDRQSDSGPVGEVFGAWRAAPTALMLLGWQRDQPALEGAAALQRADAPRGRFTRVAWPAQIGGAEAYRFLAAVQVPGGEVQDGDTLLLQGRRAANDGMLARVPPFFIDPAGFGAALAHAASGRAGTPVASFLATLFTPAAMAANPAVRAMVANFLQLVSEPDGCVEMLGAVREQCAFLQGWGRPLDAAGEVIVSGASLQRHAAREAVFQRPDIAAPSVGHVLLLPAAAAQSGAVGTVFLLGADGVRRRPVLEECRVLSEAETVGHVRGLLPSLRCDGEARAVMLGALRPRYEGRFTLLDAGHPVRLNIDLAAAADAGAYLTGWLYDPAGVVDSVRFCAASGAGARLDQAWTRIPRPDVTEGFGQDPGLPPGNPAWHDHGFAAHVPPGAASGEGAHLEVVFRDGWCGFMPTPLAPLRDEAARLRLLASVDLHKPSGAAVIEQQLAPFFSRLAGSAQPVAGLPPLPGPWSCALVVPLAAVEPPRALLAHLLREKLAAHEGLVFVCGDAWPASALAALAALAGFYGAQAVVARVGGVADMRAALRVAAALPGIAHALLLSPSAVGRTPGWRGALEAAARAHGPTACVSPTVLYEDDSIRFAGCGGAVPLEHAPYARLRRPMSGLPSGFAPSGPASVTGGVSAACCLVPRRVLDALPAPGAAALAWEPEFDLALHLRGAGAACLWAPAVQVHAPDETAPPGRPERAQHLVARWCVRARLAEEG